MAFTGRLGTSDSELGRIELGSSGAAGASVDRTATDAPATSESVTRAATLARAITAAPATSEAVTRSGTFARATTDAPTTSDVVEAIKSIQKTATDAPQTSESATRSGSFIRATTDAPAASEAATRSVSVVRITSDVPTTAETASQAITKVRAVSDAPATADSAGRSGSFSRSASEGISVADAVISDRTTFGQHSRPDDHFDTQDDLTIITAAGFDGYAPNTTLATILADMYTHLAGIVEPNGRFGLTAFIQPYFSLNAVILKTQSTSFGLTAWLGRGGSFGLASIVTDAIGGSFGLDAYLLPVGVERIGTFGLSAIRKRTQSHSFTLAAVVRKTQSSSFGLAAVIV